MALRATPEELRNLLVKRLAVVDAETFERAAAVAARPHVPFEPALVEHGRLRGGIYVPPHRDRVREAHHVARRLRRRHQPPARKMLLHP